MEPRYVERFWSRVVKSPGCWEWNGAHFGNGYAEMWDGSRNLGAHRVSYEIATGKPIPPGLVIDHLCRNRGCVNPAHLELVDQQANVLRAPESAGGRNALKTHCSRGHPYDEANTYHSPSGRRQCRACWKVDNKERWAKYRAVTPYLPPITHCPQGHPYDEANTYHSRDHGRMCRACARERARQRRLKKKAS